MAHRNRPDPATGLFSSEVIFRRKIKDLCTGEAENQAGVAPAHGISQEIHGKTPPDQGIRTKQALPPALTTTSWGKTTIWGNKD